MQARAAPPEAATAGITAFLAAALGVGDLRLVDGRRHLDGFSWETWDVTVEGAGLRRRVVVKREPEAGLLDWYDTGRQVRLHEAIARAGTIPIAPSLCADPAGDWTGRPLFVSEHVDGIVPAPWNFAELVPDEEARRRIVLELAAIAARAHALDLADLPADLRGADDDDPAAEVGYWEAVYERDRRARIPVLEWAFGWLRAHGHLVSPRRTLVHGDLRVGNVIVRDGTIAALLDWEGAHVGDPVEDLANAGMRLFGGGPATISGVVPTETFLAAYEAAAGEPVPRGAYTFWTVFGTLRSAVTFVTAARRFEDGLTDDLRFPVLGIELPVLLRHLLKDIPDA
jgi:aminoglycoside phosphotransferase (APT) family kinase protein